MARFCVLPRAFRGKRVDGKKTRPISGVAGTWPKKEYKTRFSTAVSHNSSFSSALRSAFFLSASYTTTMMSLRLALLALVAVSARSALSDSSRNLPVAAAAAAASGGGPFGGGSSTSTAAVGVGNPFFWGRRLQGSNPEKNAAKVAKWTGEVRRWNEKIAAKVERRNEKTAAKIQKVNAKNEAKAAKLRAKYGVVIPSM